MLGVFLSVSSSANEQLMSKAGCIACHRIDQKLIGPAFKLVAARYRNNPDAPALLFAKVREGGEGGEGVWGDLPMVPNGPNKISDVDLQTLIAWVLSL